MNPTEWAAGLQVRLISDPGTVGVCTGNVRVRESGTKVVQVVFPGAGLTYQPEYELELVPSGVEDHFELVRQGRYSRVEHLRRSLTHIQLSGRLANLVYSMETTHTEYYPHQFKPVLSFLESPSNGLLIADEVGLGKTIEAGLIWTELRARLDARRLLIVCPAMLREKWRDELDRRFGIDAEVMNAEELLAALQKPKGEVQYGKAIICSMQGIRPPRGWREDSDDSDPSPRQKLARFLQANAEDEPLIDLVVIDEAHYFRNPDNLTNRLGRLLRDVSEHVVLLSATPINLAALDLFNLLNIVDPDTFRYPRFFTEILKRNEPLVKARQAALNLASTGDEIRALLQLSASASLAPDGSSQIQQKSLDAILKLSLDDAYLAEKANRIKLANRIERLNLLGHALSRTRRVEVIEFRTVRRPFTQSVPMAPPESQFYHLVTEAIREYAWSRNISDGFLLAPPQRQVSSCMVAAARAWRNRSGNLDELLYEDFGLNEQAGDAAPLIEVLIHEVLPKVDLNELERLDSKYSQLLDRLRKIFSDEPNEKVILFSYFRGTLNYLSTRLESEGIKCQVLMGGMAESKHVLIERFRTSSEIRVLLSSEVAAEGVDLQFARVLINYDLPWNPMKVEQRIGRIDRIGQQAETVVIWNLCSEGTIDQKILTRLYSRLRIFERALGGYEDILGAQIRDLTTELLSRHRTPQEETDAIEKAALAIEQNRFQQEQLEAQASNLIAHGGYVLAAVHAAHEFSRRITNDDLLIYVRDYLDQHAEGHTLRELTKGEYEIRLPPATASRLGEFLRARRIHGQTRLESGAPCRCHFVNRVKRRLDRVESISQFHPLVRFISEDLNKAGEATFPLVAAKLERQRIGQGIAPGSYAFTVKRWTFSGLRTEEELRARAVHVGSGELLGDEQSLSLVNHARTNGRDWLTAPGGHSPAEILSRLEQATEAVEADYSEEGQRRQDENSDRIALQLAALNQHHNRRLEQLKATLAIHTLLKRQGLARATEGRISKLEEKTRVQREALRDREQLKKSQFDVIFGIVDIE